MANRTIAIGDIHGCANALRALLDVIKPERSDTIVTLGDYVDRGPSSAEVIDIMTELISTCRLVPIFGNHEIMMNNATKNRQEYEFWLFNGGQSTLQSYGGDMNNMPMHHHTFLNFCKPYHETDTHIFVHAAYDSRLEMEKQTEELLFWQHVGEAFIPEPHFSGKTVVCGHTPQESGEVGDLGHIKLVDTFCYGDKWLTAYDVETGNCIQARTDGMLHPVNNTFQPRKTSVSFSNGPVDEFDIDPSKWPFTESAPSSLEMSGDEFEKLTCDVAKRLGKHLENLDQFPSKNSPPTDSEIDQFTNELAEPIPKEPSDFNILLDRVLEGYIPHSFNTAGHGYLAYIPGGGLPDSSIGDLVGGLTNRYVSVWTAAPAMAQMESTVVRWFCDMVGYGSQSGGFLTTGGSIANLGAVIAARVRKLGDDFSRGTIYASSQTHHCVNKAAFMAGFPKSSMRMISVNDDQTIDLGELKRKIVEDRSAGFSPMMVVANAGTTNTGAVDDIDAIKNICDDENMWLHVDAAYGGFFALTEHGRKLMRGIENADSIVLDPHKGLFVPYGTGSLLVKNRDDLLPAFSFTSDYMPQMTGDRHREDFCEISPELSRDNRGLRIWLPIKRHGIAVFERLLQEKLDLTRWAAEQLKSINARLSSADSQLSLQIVAPPQLSIVVFRLCDQRLTNEENSQLNRKWLDQINRDGAIMMTGTTLNEQFVLRICVLSFRTHIDRMQRALRIISSSADAVLSERKSSSPEQQSRSAKVELHGS